MKYSFFKKSALRDRENLTESQIRYIQRWNIKAMIPFFWLFRKEWNVLVYTILFSVSIFASVFVTEIPKEIMDISSTVDSILAVIAVILILIAMCIKFLILRNERRNAWNRKEWESFDIFRKAEKNGIIFFSAMFLLLYLLKLSLLSQYRSSHQWSIPLLSLIEWSVLMPESCAFRKFALLE